MRITTADEANPIENNIRWLELVKLLGTVDPATLLEASYMPNSIAMAAPLKAVLKQVQRIDL